MIRTIAVAVGLGLLGVGGFGVAATTGVSLTATGPQPGAVTVDWGDTVSFTNADSDVHKVSIPRLGVSSPDLAPGASFAQPFAVRAGSYPFRQQGGTLFTGQVVVRVDGKLTLAANRSTIGYGKTLRLTGRSTQPGAQVTIQQLPFGASGDWVDARQVAPSADGTFSASFKPTSGTKYRALAADGQVRSSQITVTVQPIVRIAVRPRSSKAGKIVTVTGRVTPANAARTASLELYDARRKAWRNISSRALSRKGAVVFKWTALAGKWRLRVALRRGELTAGYEPSVSPGVAVTVAAPPERSPS